MKAYYVNEIAKNGKIKVSPLFSSKEKAEGFIKRLAVNWAGNRPLKQVSAVSYYVYISEGSDLHITYEIAEEELL